MTKQQFTNVWDAIEDTPEQAENMRLRSTLMMALKEHLTRNPMSTPQAAQLLGVAQSRIGDLLRGKINAFELDTLVNMVGSAGLRIEIKVLEVA